VSPAQNSQRGYGTQEHTKRKVKPLGEEGIRHKINTKWKLKPSGEEGIRHRFTYKMEAEALRGIGDMAQIYIQNGS
jgi:hypothetical protein